MHALSPTDLLKLEDYARERPAFRARVLAHKAARRVALGEHMTLLFEDRLTVQFQVQEMLRIERIFEADAINEELAAYNPLIPDGSNWKATCLIEYDDPDERKRQLVELRGVEDRIHVRVTGFQPVLAVADEDMERSNESKTSAVHFLRFEFSPEMIQAIGHGAQVLIGVDHPAYRVEQPVPENTLRALHADFD
jgi:hypothetical protein